jgi:hypothetical protein
MRKEGGEQSSNTRQEKARLLHTINIAELRNLLALASPITRAVAVRGGSNSNDGALDFEGPLLSYYVTKANCSYT